jgi:hypothetical protein
MTSHSCWNSACPIDKILLGSWKATERDLLQPCPPWLQWCHLRRLLSRTWAHWNCCCGEARRCRLPSQSWCPKMPTENDSGLMVQMLNFKYIWGQIWVNKWAGDLPVHWLYPSCRSRFSRGGLGLVWAGSSTSLRLWTAKIISKSEGALLDLPLTFWSLNRPSPLLSASPRQLTTSCCFSQYPN